MTDARLQIILETIQNDKLEPDDLTQDEYINLIDNELVTTNRIGKTSHPVRIVPGQYIPKNTRWYSQTDGLTPQKEKES